MDEEFLGLCDDYEEAIRALHRWQASTARDASEMVDEYLRLCRELQDEIREAATRWMPAR